MARALARFLLHPLLTGGLGTTLPFWDSVLVSECAPDHFKGNFRDKHSNIILRSLKSENLLPLHTTPAGIVSTGRELKILLLKIITWGLPWWRSGWESACQCRGHGFEPWSGKIPHAAQQLGPWATITEPARLEPVLRSGRGRDGGRPAHRDEEWPPLAATRESPRTATKTQHSHK